MRVVIDDPWKSHEPIGCLELELRGLVISHLGIGAECGTGVLWESSTSSESLSPLSSPGPPH